MPSTSGDSVASAPSSSDSVGEGDASVESGVSEEVDDVNAGPALDDDIVGVELADTTRHGPPRKGYEDGAISLTQSKKSLPLSASHH